MYDEPVAVPIIDLLDSSMMSQYISAAREQYNQAVQDQKEFAKEFGELYGPNANVNKEFYDITRGAVNKGLDTSIRTEQILLDQQKEERIQPRLLERDHMQKQLTLKLRMSQ